MNVTVITVIFVVGLAAMVLELFIPGVIVGVCGLAAVVASIIMAYHSEACPDWVGHVMIGISIVFLPVFFLVWRTVVPKIMGHHDSEKDYHPASQRKDSLLGAEGVSITYLRPAGVIEIDGRRVDVVTQGELIPKGAHVRIIEVAGNRVMVEEIRQKKEEEEGDA